MPKLHLTVLSLRYSSWSMRAWLTLTHSGATFETTTVSVSHMRSQPGGGTPAETTSLTDRRELGSVHGLFPVLRIDGTPIHESLAICEYVADTFPQAGLWPDDAVARARARAVSCEMVSGFGAMRDELSSHLFGRVAGFSPGAAARADIARVFELWDECLNRSGGPFLFGRFTIADAMYFPVLGRFRTYGVDLAGSAVAYADALESLPAVRRLIEVASAEPRIPMYDAYVEGLGGDPDGALPV